jgi:hypoxanthine phosphoribosyltransferase
MTEKYQDKDLICICILNGSFMFFSDLIRQMNCDFKCDFLGLSSYAGTQSTGEVKVTLDLSLPIKDKHIVLVEDIVDTGTTMDAVYQMLKTRQPASIETVTLLHKPEAQKTDFKPDYIGFSISNEFVVGDGLDYNQQFRTLPYVAQVQNLN